VIDTGKTITPDLIGRKVKLRVELKEPHEGEEGLGITYYGVLVSYAENEAKNKLAVAIKDTTPIYIERDVCNYSIEKIRK
jgi:hypothetical protein